MTFKATEFTTDTGRIVWTGADSNSLYDPVTVDFDGNPLKPNDDGTPAVIYRLGFALPKRPGETHFSQSTLGAIIWAQGHRDHPQAAQSSDFSWKVVDGDSTQKTAKAKSRPCDKEGFPGHWVFTFSSGFPFKFVNADGSAYLLDRNAVKVGDYVQIAGTTAGNTGKSPGVYINHRVVSLQFQGKAITTGPDPKTLGFGHKGAVPDGASPVGALNTGSAPPPPPPAPPAGNAAPPPPPQQQVPQVPVSPAPGFVGTPPPPPPGNAAPPPPPPPPANAGPKMTAKANGQTYAAFIAGGWTDATLKANGYME